MYPVARTLSPFPTEAGQGNPSASNAGAKQNARPKGKFFIRDVYLDESFWTTNRAEVALSGFDTNPTQLRIVVRDPAKFVYGTSHEGSEWPKASSRSGSGANMMA